MVPIVSLRVCFALVVDVLKFVKDGLMTRVESFGLDVAEVEDHEVAFHPRDIP